MTIRKRSLCWLSLAVLGACGGKATTYGPGADGDGGGSGGAGTGSSGNATRSSAASASSQSGGNTTSSNATSSDGTSSRASVTVVSVTAATATTTTGPASTTGGTPDAGWIPLQPFDGWVDASDNVAGIQGSFWTASDLENGGTAVINPATFEIAGYDICVDGTAEQVRNMEYDVYWGALVGFNLNQGKADGVANPYDAVANGVTGIGFDISALPIGGQLRFGVHLSGETNDYCKIITNTNHVQMRWEELELACWAPVGQAPDPTRIESIYWQIVTNDSAPYDFDFCISGLAALTN